MQPNGFALVSLLYVPFGSLSVTAALLMVFYGFKLLEIMYLLLCFAIIEGMIKFYKELKCTGVSYSCQDFPFSLKRL